MHASLLMAFKTQYEEFDLIITLTNVCPPFIWMKTAVKEPFAVLSSSQKTPQNKPRPWSGWNIILQKSHDWISEEHFLTEQKLKKSSDCSHHVSQSRSGRAKFAEASTKQFSIILEFVGSSFVVGVMMKAGPYLTEGHCLLVDSVQSESSKGSFECGR